MPRPTNERGAAAPDADGASVERSLDERFRFAELGAEAQARLRALAPLFERELPAAVDRFYDQIGAFDGARAVFRDAESEARARRAQTAHWISLADRGFDARHGLASMAVGRAHARLGVEPRWYMGSYALIVSDLVAAVVRERLDGAAPEGAAQSLAADLSAVVKAAFLDADMAVSAYIDAAQSAERAVARRLRIALSAAHAGVIEIDFARRSAWCSPEVTAFLGRALTYEDFTERPDSFCHADDADAFARKVRTWPVGREAEFEFRVRLPSGRHRWVQLLGEVEADAGGKRSRLVALVADIHVKKRQELALMAAERAAHEASEAKSRFLANVSHEIRTPMNGVLGVLGLLDREALSPEGRLLLGQAQDCGQMLSQLLNDILDASKIEAGKLELSPEPLDPGDTLQSVVAMLRPLAEAKGLALQTRIAAAPARVLADPVRLKQMLFNLIGNAVKFTETGRVEARLDCAEAGDGGLRLRFEIEDTGVGVPVEAQKALFARFRQADRSTAKQFGGTGLGLNITRSIAELMGGEVGFTSREGAGSTFWIDVPVPQAGEPEPEAAPTDAGAPFGGLEILVADDHPTNRLVASMLLERLGARTVAVADGLAALEAMGRKAFDAVLMDIEMPGMGGLEATRRIRALPGPIGRVPIVGLTGNVHHAQWAQYRAAGMSEVVAKPISVGALLTAMARALDAAAALQAL